MNIKFCYLYRDGANYKRYNEVTFLNCCEYSLDHIESQIKDNLIDGLWFYANEWQIPELFFEEFDDQFDPTWHEFEMIEETEASPTSGINIDEFLRIIQSK